MGSSLVHTIAGAARAVAVAALIGACGSVRVAPDGGAERDARGGGADAAALADASAVDAPAGAIDAMPPADATPALSIVEVEPLSLDRATMTSVIVTIRGTGFGTSPMVRVGGTPVPIRASSPGVLEVEVASTLGFGALEVTVTRADDVVATAPVPFVIYTSAPVLEQADPRAVYEPAESDPSYAFRTMAVGDVGGSAALDLITTAVVPGSDRSHQVAVMLGAGDGTFGVPEFFASSVGDSRSVETGDVNGDGRVDIVVAGICCASSIDLYFAEVGGGFTHQPLAIASGVEYAKPFDLDADGDLDLAFYRSEGPYREEFVILENKAGAFEQRALYDLNPGLSTSAETGQWDAGLDGFAIADFTGDGQPDFALGLHRWGGDPIDAVALFDGALSPGLAAPTMVEYTANNWYAVDLDTADLDGDGQQDIIIALFADAVHVVALLGDGAGGFTPRSSLLGEGNAARIAQADLSGDGAPDLITSKGAVIRVHLGGGDGSFAPGAAATHTMVGPAGAPVTVVDLQAADFTGDGLADIAIAYETTSAAAVRHHGIAVLINRSAD